MRFLSCAKIIIAKTFILIHFFSNSGYVLIKRVVRTDVGLKFG